MRRWLKIHPQLSHLWTHYKYNQTWFWTAIETYALAIYFVFQQHVFDVEPPSLSPIGVITHPLGLIFIGSVATLTMVISLWNIHLFWARPIMIGFELFVWIYIAIAFTQLDILQRNPDISAVLSWCVVARTASYAFLGGDVSDHHRSGGDKLAH